jgi:hypothetical protein
MHQKRSALLTSRANVLDELNSAQGWHMITRISLIASIVVALAGSACRTPATGRPVVDTGPKPPDARGTIAGHVRSDGGAPVVSRLVRITSVETGRRYDTTTTASGAYSVKVPQGRYRLELQLEQGERIVKAPGETTINASDLDPDRDFEVTTGRLNQKDAP